jgi:hypothetical protein
VHDVAESHETAERIPVAPLPVAVALHEPPAFDSMRVCVSPYPLDPTATQFVALVQETPFSTSSSPAGSKLGVMLHIPSVNVSTSV